MKKKACILSILLLATLFGTAGAKEINVLFMGNSFTFRHDLPELVKSRLINIGDQAVLMNMNDKADYHRILEELKQTPTKHYE